MPIQIYMQILRGYGMWAHFIVESFNVDVLLMRVVVGRSQETYFGVFLFVAPVGQELVLQTRVSSNPGILLSLCLLRAGIKHVHTTARLLLRINCIYE